MGKLMLKATHHQRGVLPSATPAIRSEIHPIDLWFSTKGSRSSTAGGGRNFNCVTAPAISGLLSRHVPRRQERHAPRLKVGFLCFPNPENSKAYRDNQAWLGLDCEFGRGTSAV